MLQVATRSYWPENVALLYLAYGHPFYPILLLHSIIGYWHHHVVRLTVCL